MTTGTMSNKAGEALLGRWADMAVTRSRSAWAHRRQLLLCPLGTVGFCWRSRLRQLKLQMLADIAKVVHEGGLRSDAQVGVYRLQDGFP